MSTLRKTHWLFDKASNSDGLEGDDAYIRGWVSVGKTRSGGVTIAHADSRILVYSEHLYLIVEGKAPSWMTLRAPAPKYERQQIDRGDIRETGSGAFVDWSVHISGENRTVIYLLGAYRAHTDSYEACRTDR